MIEKAYIVAVIGGGYMMPLSDTIYKSYTKSNNETYNVFSVHNPYFSATQRYIIERKSADNNPIPENNLNFFMFLLYLVFNPNVLLGLERRFVW